MTAQARCRGKRPPKGTGRCLTYTSSPRGKCRGYGVTTPVIDHMNREATELIIKSFEDGFAAKPGLKELYQEVGGSFFDTTMGTCQRHDGLFEPRPDGTSAGHGRR